MELHRIGGNIALPGRAVQLCENLIGPGLLILVDIQGLIACLAGNIVFPHVPGDFLHILLRHIAPPALMIAQRPFLRQRSSPRQIGIAGKHLRHGVPGNVIVIKAAPFGAEPIVLLRLLPHVEIPFEGIVKEKSIDMGIVKGHEKGNGFVQRLEAVHLRRRIVRIPHLIVIMSLVQKARLVSESVKMQGRLQLFHRLYFTLLHGSSGRMSLLLKQAGADPLQRPSLPSIIQTDFSAVLVKKINIEIVAYPHGHLPRMNPEAVLFFLQRQIHRNRLGTLNGF